MVKIRLARVGRKKDPVFRIVAISSERKATGKALEILGYWHPRENVLKIDKKKLENWVGKGAFVSATVRKLLK